MFTKGPFHVEESSSSLHLCWLRLACDLFHLGGVSADRIIQQCSPRRTLLANGNTVLLAPNGKVFGAYAKQNSVNEEASRNMLSYLQSGQEVACTPSYPSCWWGLGPCFQHISSIPNARLCPARARARSPIGYQLCSHTLVTTPLDMERKPVYDPVMPSPFFHLVNCRGQLNTNVYLYTRTQLNIHLTRLVPRHYTGGTPHLFVYLAFSTNAIIVSTNLTTLFTANHHYSYGNVLEPFSPLHLLCTKNNVV